MTTKILVLASNPSGTEPLKVNDEIRSIQESHKRSQNRDEFTVRREPAVRISELQRIILNEKPRIVHFCGHGTGHQGLVLENDAGQQQLVSTEALTDLLKIFDRRIECVVLNACHSQVQGKQINQHINYLIATKKEIRDDAALLFTKGFYDALFNGETYKDAYKLGCNRVHLELYKKNSSERKLVPVYSEKESKYIDLPQHEILLFLEKNPLNIILKNDIPISNYTYQENVEDKSKSKNTLPCPYRGLFHFNPNDAEFFFGREVFIEELFQATQTHNFIPVLGASGSGKSSVVLAGLVPRLEQEGNWKFAHFRPGDEPFHALANALVSLHKPDLNLPERLKQSRQLAQSFEQGSVPLKDVFAQIESQYSNTRVLLIADQFEELYTLCPKEKIRHSFLDLLLDSFQSSPSNLQFPPVLVTTMRADFLGDALSYRPLADVLNSNIQLVGAMNREELSQVIEKPAEILGVEFEPGLVERVLDEVKDEPGNLPLLEFALTELWKKQTGNQLTHKAYEKIFQVKGALAKYAEQKYQALEKNEKEQARQIFIQLVRLGEENNDTRRRVNRNQIGKDNWKLVIRKHGLADSRLVITNRDNNDRETLEIVHESLISHWKRLRQWLNDDRENLNKQRKLEDEAKQWEDSGQKTDYLLLKKRLKEAKDFQKEQKEKYPLSELAESFIAKSSKHQRRELIKSLGLFLIIPLIGTVMIGHFVVREIQLTNLKSAILYSANLKSAILKSAILKSADLSRANLKSADLYSANLKSADLYSANLKSANLKSANLKSANLYSADLSRADLSRADLSRADLSRANLSRANLESTNLIEVQSLTSSQLKSACYWEKAVYKVNWDYKTGKWQVDEEANQKFIEKLKKDKASDPKEPVDCSRWE